MDLTERIRRRKQPGDESSLIRDYDALNPVTHLEEPIGRGPVLERMLDYLDPVFDGDLPPNAYVWGPSGAGKSAVVTALFSQLSGTLSHSEGVIRTTTRARSTSVPTFAYVDARRATTDFALYRTILDELMDEPAPRQGVGTDVIRSRLVEILEDFDESALVAVDHVDEPGTLSLATVAETLDLPVDSLSWVGIGRTDQAKLDDSVRPPEHLEFPAYEEHALVDVLTGRASSGLARRAVTHGQLRRVVQWANGDAHRALSALFGAADLAATHDHERILERDVDKGIDAVPIPTVALGRVLALSENRQQVLRRLVDLEPVDSVDEAASAIADHPDVDLSASTVRRYLYELAEDGIAERVASDEDRGRAGRPPSRIDPRFPTLVFRRLYDLQGY